MKPVKISMTHMSSRYVSLPEHGEQTTRELLDAIEALLTFSRAGTFDEEEGEREAQYRARALLSRYRPAITEIVYRGPTPEIGDLCCHRVEPGCILSIWEPSAEERKLLAKGGKVCLWIHTEPIPPVALEVHYSWVLSLASASAGEVIKIPAGTYSVTFNNDEFTKPVGTNYHRMGKSAETAA